MARRRQNVSGFGPIVDALSHIRRSGNEWPKLRFDLDGVGRFVMALNGKGAVNLTDGRPYDANTWYGRITADGEFQPSGALCALDDEQARTVWALLTALRDDVLGTLSSYGKDLGWCCVCGRPLSNAESVARGIGPECAAKLEGM